MENGIRREWEGRDEAVGQQHFVGKVTPLADDGSS